MKVALVSQRVDILQDRGERRDATDQRLLDWLATCDLLPVPVPNSPGRVAPLWESVRPSIVVLSGGNDLAAYGGDAPERDATEQVLLTRAVQTRVPVLGVCKGAQLLLHQLGHALEPVPGHIGARHSLRFEHCERSVNSYHSWGWRAHDSALRVLARADDDVVEAFAHAEIALLGIMWHPEREPAFHAHDRSLVERYLLRGETR